MLFDIYVFMLSAVIMLLIYSFYFIKSCPGKIRVLGNIAVVLLMLKHVSAVILLLSGSMVYLYMFKTIYFLNFAAIPVVTFMAAYIFIRRNDVNFNYVFLASAIVCIVYIFALYRLPVSVGGFNGFGYYMSFQNTSIAYWTYVIFNTVVFWGAVSFSNNSNANSIGVYMIMVSSLIAAAETIGFILNREFFPQSIVGDMLFIVTFLYALFKVKKQSQ